MIHEILYFDWTQVTASSFFIFQKRVTNWRMKKGNLRGRWTQKSLKLSNENLLEEFALYARMRLSMFYGIELANNNINFFFTRF